MSSSFLNALGISIHAPSRERPGQVAYTAAVVVFQSTLPYGSDSKTADIALYSSISIHAPLRERPLLLIALCLHNIYFNPRSLTGATGNFSLAIRISFYFNPRSLTGATTKLKNILRITAISIHAPLRERPFWPR